MVKLENYVSKAIREDVDYETSEELIRKTKQKYLSQIYLMHSGASIIKNLTEHYNSQFDDEDTGWIVELADKLTLAEIYYHYAHILTSKYKVYLFKFNIVTKGKIL